MNELRQRLAWAVLIASFLLCIGITVGSAYGGSSFLRRSTRPLSLQAQANQGTLVVALAANGSRAVRPGEPPLSVAAGERLQTTPADTGLVLVRPPESAQILARIQLYGGSSLVVDQATAPRYTYNPSDRALALRLEGGRIQISVVENGDPPLVIRVITPQGGQVTIWRPGQYSLSAASDESQVAVKAGSALLTSGPTSMTLTGEQRALFLPSGQMVGPLSSQRNLVRNGAFTAGLDGWLPLAGDVERADQPPAEIQVREIDGEPRLRFSRLGQGHADSSVRQVISQDVTDFDSLRLEITLRIVSQSVLVCGIQGSECPLTVSIEYEDVSGGARVWQQGFYAVGEFNNENAPDVCRFCAPPLNEHVKVALGQIVFHDSGNLLALLSQQGLGPRRIRNVLLTAAGHSFEAEVIEIALLADE